MPGLPRAAGISALAAAAGWRFSQASAVARTDFSRASQSAISTATSGAANGSSTAATPLGPRRALSSTMGSAAIPNLATTLGIQSPAPHRSPGRHVPISGAARSSGPVTNRAISSDQ